MDPRLEVPNKAGGEIRITLLDGIVWTTPRPPIGTWIEPYLYPNQLSNVYHGQDPVFYLEDGVNRKEYYFVKDQYDNLSVVFVNNTTPEITLPEVESGLVRVPLSGQNIEGQTIDHVWAVPKGIPIDWSEDPYGYNLAGEPIYHVVDKSGYGYTLETSVDYTHTPPWVTVMEAEAAFPETASPEKPSKSVAVTGKSEAKRKTLGIEISILVLASVSLIFIAGFSKKL